MADWITIKDVPPYDGRYPLDLLEQDLTTREWGWIKRYAGYLPVTLDADTFFADPEVIAVLALVALRRNNKIDIRDIPAVWERVQDAPFGTTIVWEGEPAAEDDADPPPPSSDASSNTNGPSSRTESETLVLPPSPSGPPPSDTSASPVTVSAR